MTADKLRALFIEYFVSHNHVEIAGKSLLPENDPTVLFTTAGMHPLVPYILGQTHPSGTRLVNCQRCLRTGDIDSVGDSSHLTFFEMLGNWSLGDYFKEESIAMSYEFLCSDRWLGIDPERIFASVFAGDAATARDEASLKAWKAMGIPSSRIYELPRSDNWWGPVGKTGPCGSNTEIFVDLGGTSSEFPGSRYLEIWNNVFMEYSRGEDGRFSPLSRQCVDTGMGLERAVAILQGARSVYETELLSPLLRQLSSLARGVTEESASQHTALRIICDHLRTSVFLIADGVLPSNLGQGYVLRRLLRRSIRHGKTVGIETPFLFRLVESVQRIYGSSYPFLKERRALIEEEIRREETVFNKTLERGEQEFAKILRSLEGSTIDGKSAFRLYDTFGFPLELTVELAQEQGLKVDETEFHEAFEVHKAQSRSDAKVKFKGGLADHSEMTTRLHTATHLLHQALRQILGPHIGQKGSNITPERLRFDFSHPEKMTEEEIKHTEDLVNQKIGEDLAITVQSMSLEDAKKMGALAFFAERYDEAVTVYSIGDFSMEVCGGPHVQRSSELGIFHIEKEQSSARGVRRIKATLEEA